MLLGYVGLGIACVGLVALVCFILLTVAYDEAGKPLAGYPWRREKKQP